jgi:very-short-patch-repair endonuclease
VLRTRPGGFKFRKQFPFEQMTADFACLKCRLIIEVDGETHGMGHQPARDAARDSHFRRGGFRVLRLPAREVLASIDGVVTAIVESCSKVGPLHRAASRRGPPPRSGEDLE